MLEHGPNFLLEHDRAHHYSPLLLHLSHLSPSAKLLGETSGILLAYSNRGYRSQYGARYGDLGEGRARH